MKIIEDTLDVSWETWSDPGDYPSAAGGRPLPSYDYPVVDGHIIYDLGRDEIRFFEEDEDAFHEAFAEALRKEVGDQFGLEVEKYGVKLDPSDEYPTRVTMWVEEASE